MNAVVGLKPVIEPGSKPLEPRRERFCLEYLRTGNLTKSAILAGYSEKSARSIASENLTKPNIKNRINYLQRQVCEALGLNPVWLAYQYKRIADADIADFYDGRRLLNPSEIPVDSRLAVLTIETNENGTKRVGLINKIDALKQLEKFIIPLRGNNQSTYTSENRMSLDAWQSRGAERSINNAATLLRHEIHSITCRGGTPVYAISASVAR